MHVDERGFIPVTPDQRTNIGHIFAIGDVVAENPFLEYRDFVRLELPSSPPMQRCS